MKVGVTIPASDLSPRRQRSFQEMVADAVEAERLGYDSVWVMDHVFVERDGAVSPAGPDPMALLAYIAARTERVQLGTLVLCAAFRPPAQLAREAKAIEEASGGRLLLGVGSGWHQPEFDAFGLPFDHLVGRFEEYLEALTQLLGDGPSDFAGRYQRLERGQVFGPPLPPPWVAASGPRMLSITGRLAGGWNSAWHGAGTDAFTAGLAAVEAAMTAAGRARSELVASAGVFVVPLEAGDLAEAEGRLAGAGHPGLLGERVVSGPPEAVAEALRGYARAGCQHLVLNFSPSPFRSLAPGLPARLAPLLDHLR
jgi:alkanesulfonate monooxygenase SsuD/methylene tetrahydromethanopterin reductase-like flavin-dependent oxidoreductase (luciferase family)